MISEGLYRSSIDNAKKSKNKFILKSIYLNYSKFLLKLKKR